MIDEKRTRAAINISKQQLIFRPSYCLPPAYLSTVG
jgi:hypothetical protein